MPRNKLTKHRMRLISIIISSFLCFHGFAQEGSFSEVSSGSDLNLHSIFFIDDEIGYVGADSLFLLKTIDGGETWTPIEMQGIGSTFGSNHIKDLFFENEFNGYALVEGSGFLHKTEDGGNNWVIVENTPGNMCYPEDFEIMADGSHFLTGWGCFQGALFGRTVDDEWDEIVIELSPNSQVRGLDMDFYNDQIGIIGCTEGKVYRTIDGGENWIASELPTTDSITSIAYKNENLIYASTTDTGSALYMSEDGGDTWDFEGTSLTFFYPRLNGLLMDDQEVIFGRATTGGQGFVSYRVGEDNFWEYQSFSPELRAGFTKPNGAIYVVGDEGIIIRTDAVLNINITAPKPTYSVYPNPTIHTLNFKGLPNDGQRLTYKLSNGIGQIVKQGNLKGGQIDLPSLPSDVYYIEIKTADKRSLGVQKIRID